ncbi:hypothetical protein MN116_007230 [Schistosoma mekongi]|uniref:Rab3 GTPase-activating protein non-catalytic subunit n=1 Tax=Schistosoma mekongi TaxID=38744 RepID=A0AAE2D4A7_SCHME|nr:hypothetical protein MN116_007230 [Schistosoma mekongi]
MSLDVFSKCDFSEVKLPSGWIRKVLFSIPPNLKVVVIGVQNRMLVFGGLSGKADNLTLLSELKFQSCIKAISCLCFSSNNDDSRSGWYVYAIGLDNGELLFLHENNNILLCIRTGLDTVTSIQLTSCCKNLCVLCKSTIICLNLEDLESVLLNSCTHLSEHTLQSFRNSTFQYTKTIRYQSFVIPTDGEKKHFSCLSKYQLGTFDLLVRRFAFESHLCDGKLGVSLIQTRWTTAGSSPFVGFSFMNENTDPGVSHFASFVYQEAKRAMFGIRKFSNNDPELLTVTWPQQKDDITYPIVQCSPLLKKTLNLSHGLADSRRNILSSGVAVSPDHHWLAIPDSLGRVLLVDAYKERVVRMWKGYRDAEVAFLEVCDSETSCIGYCNQSYNPVRKTLCLLIHAPHLHSLELWCLIHGPRIVLWDVVEPVRLIKTDYNSYVNTLKSNELSPKYYQVVLIDSSGCIYAIGLNASLCLSDTNTQAAIDYQEYKVLQTVYETFDRCSNNIVSDLCCPFVSDLLAHFQTTQWFERALTHILSYPDLSPQMILDIITSYVQLIRKDDNIGSQVKNMNLKICSNVEHLINFYLTFYSFYDVDSNKVKVKYEFTENSLRSCVEFVADLLSWDPEDAERCLQLYAICGSILSGSTSSDGKPLPIQMFLNSFQYTLVANNEIENALADSPEHHTEYIKQFHLPVIRSDNCRKTLTSFGSYIFRPYINGLQNFTSFQTIIESSNLDPKLLLFSFTLFLLNEDNYWNFPNLVDRIHRIYCYIIYQILVELFSLPSDGMDGKDESTGGNLKNETDFRVFLDMKNVITSKQQSCSEFELTFKQVYDYCLDSYHLSSAYLVALVIRSILFQIWQTFGSEENTLKVLYDYAQRPEFTIGSSSQRFNENITNTQISSLKMSPTLFNYLSSNLQHFVDKWHHTCAQLEDLLTVGLMLLCPMDLKKESQGSHHAFDFNLRRVLNLGRCYLTGAFASWIVKTAITPEQVLNFYQGMCLETLSIEDNDDNTKDLVIRDPAHIRQVIFSLAYKRLPFTLELDTILSTTCWIHFQSWRNNPENINHLISCIEFFDRFSSAGTMIAQGLGTIMWNKGFMVWIKPILAIANGDKAFVKYHHCFPHISDVAICLVHFFRIYSHACQHAEVVPVFSVETEWSDFDTYEHSNSSFSFNDKTSQDKLPLTDSVDLDSQCSMFENFTNVTLSKVPTNDPRHKLLAQDAVNQPVPNRLSISSWEQLVIVASALVVFGRPERLDKPSRQTVDLKLYSPIDFFPLQDLHATLSPDNPNWISAGIGKEVDDGLIIRRRFFLSWLIERCVAHLALSPITQRCNASTLSDVDIHSVNRQFDRTFGAVEIYRRFSSAVLTLANHWGFPKDTVVIQHVVSLYEANLDDQAQLFLSKVQDPSNLAVRLLFIIGRRIAYRCYSSSLSTKQQLRLRVFIPLTIESWLRGLLSENFQIDQNVQLTSNSMDIMTLTFLINYVIQHLPENTNQISIAEELRDIIQAIVQLDTE